jgi:hypothetical protein
MTSNVRKAIRYALGSAVCVLFFAGSASADIYTFWKTNQCPTIGDKVPRGELVGTMEAAVDALVVRDITLIGGQEVPECVAAGRVHDCEPPAVEGKTNGLGVGLGVGGVFCTINPNPVAFPPVPPFEKKALDVFNADVVAQAGDLGKRPDGSQGFEGDVWACVVCQYEEHKFQIPALSLLGTAMLLGGLLTAGAYQLGRRRLAPTTAG